jgi:hypothetical protein
MKVNASYSQPPLVQRLYRKSEHAWSYLGKIVLLSRHLLNATVKTCHRLTLSCHQLDTKVVAAIVRLKLLSIVGVPFTLFDMRATAGKIFKSLQAKDAEGVALGSLSFVVMSGDVVDSLATFINAVCGVAANTSVPLLSAIGMPLAFGLVGLGSLSRTIQMAKTYALYKNLKGQDLQELWKLKEKSREALLRSAPAPVVAEIEKLLALLQPGKQLTVEEAQELLKGLDRIRLKLMKKMGIDVANLVANLLTFVGLSLFFTPLPPVAPFIFLAASLGLKLATLAFQDLST